jgi:hypothetical protein
VGSKLTGLLHPIPQRLFAGVGPMEKNLSPSFSNVTDEPLPSVTLHPSPMSKPYFVRLFKGTPTLVV